VELEQSAPDGRTDACSIVRLIGVIRLRNFRSLFSHWTRRDDPPHFGAMNMTLPVFGVLLLVLCGCSSMSARDTAVKECTDKGYQPGSADYLNCQEHVIREIEFKEAFQRAGNPVPATSPPPTMAPLFRF
jgi:hypothetical protein